ncbi:MAG: thioredoxin [Polyangiales bacterium]
MASQLIPSVTDRTFEAEVLQSQVPVLLDFTATWCGPCKALKPFVEKVAQSHAGRLKVLQLDIDDSPDTPSRFNIRGVPTVIVFKGGKEVARLVGLVPESKLNAFVAPHLD